MWGPAGDGKFIIAAAAAAAVTSFQIWQTYREFPFRDDKLKALWWWALVVILDGGMAALVIQLAPSGAGKLVTAGAIIAWVAVGIAVPLGSRVPMLWGRLGLGRVKVDPGVTLVYDLVRGWLYFRVDGRMSRLSRITRTRDVAGLQDRGWSAEEFAELILSDVSGRIALDAAEKERILALVHIAMGFAEPEKQLEALLTVVRSEGLSTVLDEARKRPSSDAAAGS